MNERPKEPRATSPVRVLRRPEVEARTGLARSTIYARMAERTFPRPVRLGKQSVGWIESDIDEWLDQRISGGRDGGMTAAHKPPTKDGER